MVESGTAERGTQQDIEPSKEFGHLSFKVLSEEAKLFKAGKWTISELSRRMFLDAQA